MFRHQFTWLETFRFLVWVPAVVRARPGLTPRRRASMSVCTPMSARATQPWLALSSLSAIAALICIALGFGAKAHSNL